MECQSCQKKDFMVENCERVCTYCGDVQDELIDEGRLCMVPDHETSLENIRNKDFESKQRLTSRIRGEANDAQSRKRISREKMIDDSRRMVKQLIKHPDAVFEAMDLIKSCLDAYQGRLMQSKRQGLVGACIYYLSSKHQLGITLADICKTWDIKMKRMTASLKQVKQLCPNYEYERPNIRDLVNKFIDQLETKKFDPITMTNSNQGVEFPNTIRDGIDANRNQSLLDPNDKTVLTNRVMLLINLFEAMHPFNQPTPQSLITAVVYHAWRSLDTFRMIAVNLSTNMRKLSSAIIGQGRTQCQDSHDKQIPSDELTEIRVKHSISYEKFCQICDIKYSKNGYKIVRKVQTSLLMLGKCFGDVNKGNLPWFLKDIIDNSAHLVQEHLKTEPQPSVCTDE